MLIAYGSMLLGAIGIYRLKQDNDWSWMTFVITLLLFEAFLTLLIRIGLYLR